MYKNIEKIESKNPIQNPIISNLNKNPSKRLKGVPIK
jgi:hypothetical protein